MSRHNCPLFLASFPQINFLHGVIYVHLSHFTHKQTCVHKIGRTSECYECN